MAKWNIMSKRPRFTHPSREIIYKFIGDRFKKRHFQMLDVGIVSLVDYSRMITEFPRLSFDYTGVDINPEIVKQAKTLMTRPNDKAVLWDIHHKPPEEIAGNKYDVILIRHTLNYCKTYAVLENFKPILADNGYLIIVNNQNVFGKQVVRKNDDVVYAFGKFTATFSERAYRSYLSKHFNERTSKYKGNKSHKPYQINVLKLKK